MVESKNGIKTSTYLGIEDKVPVKVGSNSDDPT